ncbi:DEAD/DEAH box helicase, partial [bacterium]|nr:DEAD/DEAH box helicase [bacterium]
MSFKQFNLDSRLMSAVDRAGYIHPTPIQAETIPLTLAGHDLIGTAQTGTGKTAAFVLPILQKLITGPKGRTQVLIITPTRELAEQIHQTIRTLAKSTQIRSATLY